LSVDLSRYRNPPWHNKGRGIVVRVLWHFVNALFLENSLNPSSALKIGLLKLFGAKVGKGVIIKPGVNVKHAWFLEIGDNTWIGERAWLDNTFAPITLGANVCISQGVYLCTGNHDWSDPAFGLLERPLTIESGAWIGAGASVLPGAQIASHCVVAGGTVISKPTEPYTVYAGNPAQPIKKRVIKETSQTPPGP
jgi:putative colanic acid biosynthesis acetyltransferase WcaF